MAPEKMFTRKMRSLIINCATWVGHLNAILAPGVGGRNLNELLLKMPVRLPEGVGGGRQSFQLIDA